MTDRNKINKPQRLDDGFEKSLREVISNRRISGLDDRDKSIRRITKGISKHSEFDKILKDLEKANMEEEI